MWPPTLSGTISSLCSKDSQSSALSICTSCIFLQLFILGKKDFWVSDAWFPSLYRRELIPFRFKIIWFSDSLAVFFFFFFLVVPMGIQFPADLCLALSAQYRVCWMLWEWRLYNLGPQGGTVSRMAFPLAYYWPLELCWFESCQRSTRLKGPWEGNHGFVSLYNWRSRGPETLPRLLHKH